MSRLMTCMLVAALVLTVAARSFGEEAKPSAAEQEAKLIAVLKSDAPRKDKADACRELGRVGGKAAVPVLAGLLANPELTHMARYGLETIPDPSVDDALRDALAKLKGLPLVGVIGSVGVRHDTKATAALARFLTDADLDVSQAAARALGKLGTSEAAKAVGDALAKAPEASQVAFCEGLFRCAEALAAKGSRDEAIAIYDRLRNLQPGPQQVRAGGLRGAILTRQKAGIPLMVEALAGSDLVLFNAAIRAAIEMKGPDVVKALADGLPKLAADKQFVVISALGKLGDVAALPAILAAAKAGDKTVRLAAIGAIPEIGSAAAVPGLVTLMTDAEADVAKAAQTALAGMPGAEVDKAVAGMLTNADAKVRATGIDLLGQRRTATAMPALLKAAEDADETVRAAGLKVLGELGGEPQMQPVLGLLLKAKSPADVQAAEGALAGICTRLSRPVLGNVVIVKAVYGDLPDGASADVTQKVAEMVKNGVTAVEASNANFGDPADGSVKKLRIDYTVEGRAATGTAPEGEAVAILARVAPPACTDALCAAAVQAKGPAKLALLRILAKGGGAKALDLVRAASKDADTEVKDGALRALCDWSTIEALPDLATLAKSADKKVKTLALRGYIRLIPLQDGPAEKKVAALKEAMDLADRKEEKRLVLAALGGIPTVESLALVTPHLEGTDLKEEASAAAVAIAEKIVQSNPAQVAAAMEQVTKATTNDRVLKKAKTLLGQAKAKPAK